MTKLQLALMLGAASVATAGVVVPLVVSHNTASTSVLGEKITGTATVNTAANGNGNGNGNGNAGGNGNGNGNGQTNKQFIVSDTTKVPPAASMLYPGATVTWQITLNNPNNFDISVTSINGTVGQPTTRSGVAVPTTTCASSNVRVDSVSNTAIKVPANGNTQTALLVRMSNDAPNGCKNLNFPLTYSGTAVKP